MNIQIQGIDVFMHHYMFSLPRPLSRPLALSLYFPPSLQHYPSSSLSLTSISKQDSGVQIRHRD